MVQKMISLTSKFKIKLILNFSIFKTVGCFPPYRTTSPPIPLKAIRNKIRIFVLYFSYMKSSISQNTMIYALSCLIWVLMGLGKENAEILEILASALQIHCTGTGAIARKISCFLQKMLLQLSLSAVQ